MKIVDRAVFAKSRVRDRIRKIQGTYALLRKLSSINGTFMSHRLLDRVMYSAETLPPLGKEYWWFLCFGKDGRQVMVLVYRKFGRGMVFNGEKAVFWKADQDLFRAVTTGWIYDGKEVHDLGVTNPVVVSTIREKSLVSRISDQKIVFKGGFPEYELTLGDLVHLKMTEGVTPENRCAYGVYLPPFGAGWIDIFTNVEGDVLGKKFVGTAHLQKVVGVMPYGSFHWARVVFQNGSIFSFFCLKPGEKSKKYFHRSMNFYDHQLRRYIRFREPQIRISEERGTWFITGSDNENDLGIVLEVYAEKKFTMKGGGSQVYIEYAVKSVNFWFRTKDKTVTLMEVGDGIGTFEDAYGLPIF